MVNSHIADGFGNLLSRVIALANKKEIKLSDDRTVCSANILAMLTEHENTLTTYFNNYDLYNAANTIHEITMAANKYINDIKPWDKEVDPTVATQCLQDLGVVLYTLVRYYGVIIPTIADKAKTILENFV